LPTLARAASAGLDQAQAEVMFGEMESVAITLKRSQIVLPSSDDTRTDDEKLAEQKQFDRKAQHRLDEMSRQKEKAERDVDKYEYDLDTLSTNFDKTLMHYNACLPSCGMKPVLPEQSGQIGPPVPQVLLRQTAMQNRLPQSSNP